MIKSLKHKYEILMLISTKSGEDGVKPVVEKFKNLISNSASLLEINEWGKRKLAYPINHETEGYYVLINFESQSSFPVELSRQCRIDDAVIRFMIIAKSEHKEHKKKQEVNSTHSQA